MLDRLPRRFLAVQIGLGIVVIRPDRQRDTPERHGTLWIDLRGSLESTKRLVMIEGVDQREALIEEELGFRLLCGDGMVYVAESRHEDGRLRRGGRVGVLSE